MAFVMDYNIKEVMSNWPSELLHCAPLPPPNHHHHLLNKVQLRIHSTDNWLNKSVLKFVAGLGTIKCCANQRHNPKNQVRLNSASKSPTQGCKLSGKCRDKIILKYTWQWMWYQIGRYFLTFVIFVFFSRFKPIC